MPKKITECVSQDKSYPNKDSKRTPTSQESDDLTLLSNHTNEFISIRIPHSEYSKNRHTSWQHMGCLTAMWSRRKTGRKPGGLQSRYGRKGGEKTDGNCKEKSTNFMTTYGLSYSHVVTPRNG